jgi:putative oxidoreductase
MDLGLLVVRLVVGALFVGHGTQKLFGWFGGGGVRGTSDMMESLGYRPGRVHAALAGLGETTGGALLALGFVTAFGALAVIGVMVNAIASVHWRKGAWAQNGGYEYPLVMLTVAAGVAMAGPGRWSLDAAIGWRPYGTFVGLAALAAGVVAGAAVYWSRRPAAAAQRAEERTRRAA